MTPKKAAAPKKATDRAEAGTKKTRDSPKGLGHASTITLKATAFRPTGNKAVHFGASEATCAVLAPILHSNHYQNLFIESDQNIIDRCNHGSSYTLHVTHHSTADSQTFSFPYRAIHNAPPQSTVIYKEVRSAAMVTCTVDPRGLRSAAAQIARGIHARHNDMIPLAVLGCADSFHTRDPLQGAIQTELDRINSIGSDAKWFFSAGFIHRFLGTPSRPWHDLSMTVDRHLEWCLVAQPLRQYYRLSAIGCADDLRTAVDRKELIVDVGQSIVAHLAHYRGIQDIPSAMHQAGIREALDRPLAALSVYLNRWVGVPQEELSNYVQITRGCFQNCHLSLTSRGMGRGPLTKLRRHLLRAADRLATTGAADYRVMLPALKMALCFHDVAEDPESMELRRILKNSRDVYRAAHRIMGDGRPLNGDLTRDVFRLVGEVHKELVGRPARAES